MTHVSGGGVRLTFLRRVSVFRCCCKLTASTTFRAQNLDEGYDGEG